MLEATKTALRIKTDAYDDEIMDLIRAGMRDLQIAGVVVGEDPESCAEDVNLISCDSLVRRAVITYVRMNFGSPEDYERLRESYDTQKVQLMHASSTTRYEAEV